MTEERNIPTRPRHGNAPAWDCLPEQGPDKAQRSGQQNFVLRLFVSGMTPNSVRAIENARGICEGHLKGRFQLEIIDIYQQPLCAKERQIVAVPTMVRELPLPLHRVVGNLSQTERVLQGLGISTTR